MSGADHFEIVYTCCKACLVSLYGSVDANVILGACIRNSVLMAVIVNVGVCMLVI